MSTGIYIEKKDIAEQELNNYKRLHELRYTVVFSYACYMRTVVRSLNNVMKLFTPRVFSVLSF